MPLGYFGSGAFLGLVVAEGGSHLAATLWHGSDAVVSTRLAYPEVRATGSGLRRLTSWQA